MRLLASTDEPTQNGCADLTDQFYEGQDNRARILNSLYDKDLPVDVSQNFLQSFHPYSTLITQSAFHIQTSALCVHWRCIC